MGDGTYPLNATIKDVRDGVAISYIKLPAFNRPEHEENCYSLNILEAHIKKYRETIKRRREELDKFEQDVDQLEQLAQKLKQ